jgi:hypothetical protein
MTHKEASAFRRPVVPCAAWHITFGGRCLNCGWEPGIERDQYIKRVYGKTIAPVQVRGGSREITAS